MDRLSESLASRVCKGFSRATLSLLNTPVSNRALAIRCSRLHSNIEICIQDMGLIYFKIIYYCCLWKGNCTMVQQWKKKLDNLIKYISSLVVSFVKCPCIHTKGTLRVFRFWQIQIFMHIENNGNKIKHLRKDTLKLNYPGFLRVKI